MTYDRDLVSHRRDAWVEDARFLIENGEPPSRVARRLGISVALLEKLLYNADRASQ